MNTTIYPNHVFSDDFRAILSEDRKYRYALGRDVADPLQLHGRAKRIVLFVGLNPSTADENPDPKLGDDHTVRKLIGFTKLWGYDRFELVNLYALRSTDPNELTRVGYVHARGMPDNERAVYQLARRAEIVVCAWGAHRAAREIGATFLSTLRHTLAGKAGAGSVPHRFGTLTKEGAPRHPLMLPYSTPLVRWDP